MKSRNLNFKKEKLEESSQSDGVLFQDSEVKNENQVEKPTTVVNVDNPIVSDKSKKKKKILRIFVLLIIAILLIVGGLGYFFVVVPAQRILGYVDDIKANGASILNDFNGKDLSNIDSYFNNIETDLNNIDGELSRYDFLASMDATKGYYENFQVARGILHKTSNVIQTTLPDLKDVLKLTGFKVDQNEVIPKKGEEEGAVTLILQQLPSYLKLYNNIEPQIEDILKDVKKIDLNYVPNIAGYNLKDSIQSSYDFIDEFPTISAQTTNFLKYVPDLVGANKPAKYLLILQNETEMRSSGGLLTAYGFMNIDKGTLGEDIFLTDMWNFQYDLWGVGRPMPYSNIYGQNVLMNLGCGGTELRVQDAGIYPDLHQIGSMLVDYYNIVQPVYPDKYPEYDYILFLDETFATNLINLIQPLEVEGYGTVTAENLYDFIKGETDQNLPNDQRKEIIKDIANAAKKKFFNLPVEKFPDILSTIIQSFQRRDLAIEAPFSADTQKYLDTYGMSGRFATDYSGGDYFHMNEAQNCSLKLNKWIRDEVTQNVTIQDNGNINDAVNVKWLQTKVYEPGLEKQYSPSTSFSYRAWVRFMTPVGTTNFNSDGYTASGYVGYYPQEYYDSIMNKEVSDNIVQFDHRRFQESDPILRQEMNVSYDLPDSINYKSDKKYTLLIQKHPGKSWGEKYTININQGGQQYSIDFVLDRDKVLTYKNGIISVDNYDKSLDWLTGLVNSIPWDKLSSK